MSEKDYKEAYIKYKDLYDGLRKRYQEIEKEVKKLRSENNYVRKHNKHLEDALHAARYPQSGELGQISFNGKDPARVKN